MKICDICMEGMAEYNCSECNTDICQECNAEEYNDNGGKDSFKCPECESSGYCCA